MNKPLLILLLSLIVSVSAFAGVYSDARAKLHEGIRPTFLDQQLQVIESTQTPLVKAATQEASFFLTLENKDNVNKLLAALKQIQPEVFDNRANEIQQNALNNRWDDIVKDGITQTELLNVAYVRNPNIQAAKQNWQATKHRYAQADYLSGLERQYAIFTDRLNLLMSPMQANRPMIAAKTPFPGVESLRGDLAQTERELALLTFTSEVRDIFANVQQIAYAIEYLNSAAPIYEQQRSLVSQMLEVTSRKFETGRASYNDVLKIHSTLSSLMNDEAVIQDQLRAARSQFNAMLNLGPEADISRFQFKKDHPLKLSLTELRNQTLTHNQEIAQSKLKVQRIGQIIAMSREMNRPEYTLGASYKTDKQLFSAPTNGAGMQQVNLRPQFGDREAFIRELQDRKVEMGHRSDNASAQAIATMETTYASLQSAAREVELYRDALVPEAKQMQQTAETDYEAGRIGFINYLDTQRRLLDTNLSLERAKRNAGQALAGLERNIGASISSIQEPNHVIQN